ncbi:MAG TPA: hypothetical protein VHG71_10285 [Verrucomicrobiae bacterium]|nr:hypothetical protein [Verrucomicrobiae bacterium]
MQEADRHLAEKSALLEILKREVQKVREEMRQTHQLYLNQQISGDGFKDIYAPLEQRKKQLETELPELEARVDFLRVNRLSADDVLHEPHSLHERWPDLPSPERRMIVEALIEKIVIGDRRIDITYSNTPSSVELCKNQQKLGLG